MIARIVDFSARHQLLIVLITVALALGGLWSMRRMPLDALPELGEKQVIVYTRWDRNPDVVENQVTYPIVTALLGSPGVKVVRGFSDFGYSLVYVVYDDSRDLYWARSRTNEALSGVAASLPEGVTPQLGPDATSLGWVFQYTLQDSSGAQSLADLRSVQDWYLRYHLKSVTGVAEVAAVGGFSKQFQVNLDPNRLRAYKLSVRQVVDAVRKGNLEVGGRVLEFAGTEYMVRGRGYLKSMEDIESIALGASESGTPIQIRDVGEVVIGPDQRRGVSDLDGNGEVVSGIVIMRQGENALNVVESVKAKLREIEPGLPEGVKVVPIYDRSELIYGAVSTLSVTILEVVAAVTLVIFFFLRHFSSAFIPAITIPIVVLISFGPFRALGLTANVMSLGGIAIAVGTLVDACIVVVEQVHKKLEHWQRAGSPGKPQAVILEAIQEVVRPSFFALLVIGVAFLPVFALENQEGRLFVPLAVTKSLSMFVAAALVVTFDPALRLLVSRIHGRFFSAEVRPEESHRFSAWLIRVYERTVWWSLGHARILWIGALALMGITVPVFLSLGSEFMPPFDEGTILYMPTTVPGVSISQAQQLLQTTDRLIKGFPEVRRVLGKAGRAETATDPAPLSMIETLIVLRPQSEWRKTKTWYSSWAPEWTKPVLRRFTPDHIRQEDLIAEMNAALTLPGLSNAWTAPIRGRVTMLESGIRTEIGLKISGPDPAVIEATGKRIEALLSNIAGTRNVFAERTSGGYFLDLVWNRENLARQGISMEDAQAAVQNAIGGENVTEVIDGRARYPVNVRYMRDFRSDTQALEQVLVSTPDGAKQIALGDLAEIKRVEGPAMLRSEDGLLTGYVYLDIAGRDSTRYVNDADAHLREQLKLAPGYAISWIGQYQAAQRVRERLTLILPVTLLVVLILLYAATKSFRRTLTVVLAVPFSAIGAVWLVYLLNYDMSVAVWVGMIALMGLDAETGLFMLLYLDLARRKAIEENRFNSLQEVRAAIVEGAAKRIRPKFMTAIAAVIGLVPALWSTGTGSEVLQHISAPMIGGLVTSFLLELLIYPSIYEHFLVVRR